ncbi:MAG: response regulator [Myxococcota bacterium]
MASVLVIDDERHLRSLLRDLLELEGHRVHVAVDGASARNAPGPFDLVVCDLRLPDGMGDALVDDLRRLGPMPALFLSGDEDSLSDLDGESTLCKPFGIESFLGKVRQLLEK